MLAGDRINENVSKNTLPPICWSNMVGKKLRLRGWDLSGEIHAEILRRLVLILCKMVGWRPKLVPKRFDLGPLGVLGRASTPLGSQRPEVAI